LREIPNWKILEEFNARFRNAGEAFVSKTKLEEAWGITT
jgi:hypothetical protein